MTFATGFLALPTFAWLPLAAIEDWLRYAIPLVFLIIYAINHMITAARGANPPKPSTPPRRKPETAERPLRPVQQSQQPPRPGQTQLNAEIEQFLKRAGERRGKPQRESAVKAPPKPPKQAAEPRKPPRRDLSDVAESVQEHLGDRGFSQRAEHLADDIVRADQQMEKHLHETFDRKVGTLGDPNVTGAGPVTDVKPQATSENTAVAATLASLLANPQSLKQMIVLNEILRRPDDRW